MAHDPRSLGPDVLAFLDERHLATFTTLRPDGSPHVAPVGFSYDPATGIARVISFAGARKVRNLREAGPRGGLAVLSQVDGGRWLSLEGRAVVTDDPDRVALAVESYARRYRQPGERPDRVAIEVTVTRVLGRG